MDTTSECNPKQELCRTDWEWRSICPHTCKSYLQSQPQGVITNQQVSSQVLQPEAQLGGAVQPAQPQQPVGQLPSQQTLQPQPTTTQTQQTAQLQPQVQQPGLVSQPQATQVGSVVQPGLMQPQTPAAV